MTERIHKLIAQSGLCSRRAAEKLIEQGRVLVNGKTAEKGMSADVAVDKIMVNGYPLPLKSDKIYLMLNKPKGYITSASDDKGRKVVTELVKNAGGRVYPIGRLDYNTEGLLLLTNDGDVANRVAHPSGGLSKQYLARVIGGSLDSLMICARDGIEIDGRKTEPCGIDMVKQLENGYILKFSLNEGRNREIRRLCESSGMRVLRLKRIAVGELELGTLRLGQYKNLNEKEIQYLKGI